MQLEHEILFNHINAYSIDNPIALCSVGSGLEEDSQYRGIVYAASETSFEDYTIRRSL